MFYKAVEEFSDIITGFSVSEHRRCGGASSMVARLQFKDGSLLHIRDYLFLDGRRKYSYHWQAPDGSLISRWDNSPHHKHISTFPHHRHTADGITESNDWSINDILKAVRSKAF